LLRRSWASCAAAESFGQGSEPLSTQSCRNPSKMAGPCAKKASTAWAAQTASFSAGKSCGRSLQAYSARQKTRRTLCLAAKACWASEGAVSSAWTRAKSLERTEKGGFLTQAGYRPSRVARSTLKRTAQDGRSGSGALEAERGTGMQQWRQCER
jgi:hypothetical protein